MKRTLCITILSLFLTLIVGSAWALASESRPDTELSRRKVVKNQTDDKKKKKKDSEKKSEESTKNTKKTTKTTTDKKSSEPAKKAAPTKQSTPAISTKSTTVTPTPRNQAGPHTDTSPLNVFADIGEGWRRHNVNSMLRHFGKGKVSLSIGGAGPKGGYFSRNQSYYLFSDLFKYTITKKFEFVQYRNIDNEKKVYAVAERYYKRRDDGRLFKDKIYVSLNREGSQWVISEIKSIR